MVHEDITEQLRGYASLARYADDLIILVESETDSKLIVESIRERLKKFNLKLSETKTSIVRFGRTAGKTGTSSASGTFNFVGFTHYGTKTRKGTFKVGRKTEKHRFRRKVQDTNDFLRRNRNKYKLRELWIVVGQKLLGHYHYYGVSENSRGIHSYHLTVCRLLFKWLNRRSQKKSFSWLRFSIYMKEYPLPLPKIYVNFYTTYGPEYKRRAV